MTSLQVFFSVSRFEEGMQTLWSVKFIDKSGRFSSLNLKGLKKERQEEKEEEEKRKNYF